MTSASNRLEAARQAEREARANWFASLTLAQQRFAPESIAKDAANRVRKTAGEAASMTTETVKEHPGTMVAIGSAIGLFLFRKPLSKLVRTQFSKAKATEDDFRSLPEQNRTEFAPERTESDEATVTIITEEV